jgi:four helix bundle protein
MNLVVATIKSFEEMDVWKIARDFSRKIFYLTRSGSFSRDFPLRDQIIRSAGSVPDNIAEGFERDGNREFIRLLSIA